MGITRQNTTNFKLSVNREFSTECQQAVSSMYLQAVVERGGGEDRNPEGIVERQENSGFKGCLKSL